MRAVEAFERLGLFTKEDSPVPLIGVKANGTITGSTAKVRITQRFENRENKAIEAVYKFPLPEGSSVCGFTVAIGDRVLRGRIEEREKAFIEYDDALMQGHGAFLVDEERPNIFTLSVGNVKPRQAVDVEIAYVTTLETDGDEVTFRLPTTISPRYVPANMPDRNGIPVDKLLNPELRLEVPYGLQLHLDVLGSKDIAGIECPSHTIRTSYVDDRTTVEFSSDTVAMDHDFVLTVTYKQGFENRGYSFSDGQHTYSQLEFTPRLVTDTDVLHRGHLTEKREVIFVLDCSGSMGGSSIAQAKKAIEAFLPGLPLGTRFNIYRFGSSFVSLFPASVDYSEETLATALKLLQQVNADLGGTELLAPLNDIYGTRVSEGAIRNIILVTDGQVGNEGDVLRLAQSDSHTRVFTVGIGFGPNEYLTKQLAALSGGTTESVAPGERIEPKVLRLFNRVMLGAVEDLVVEWGAQVEQAPLKPVVYKGERISLLARMPAGSAVPDVVKVKGRLNGTEHTWEVPVILVGGEDVAVPLLWARARISDLEEGVVATSGSRQVERRKGSVDAEIVSLAKQYGIMSRATSFITVEYRTDAEKSGGEMELRKVPSMLTRGWGGVRERTAGMPFMMADNFDGMTLYDDHGESFAGAPLRHGVMRRGAGAADSAAFSSCSGSMPCPAPVDQLTDLLAMQSADGGFVVVGNSQAQLVALNLPALKQAASRLIHGGHQALKLVTTAVVLALLDAQFGNRRDEWLAVTEKSRKWLQLQVSQLNPTIDGKPLEDWARGYASRT